MSDTNHDGNCPKDLFRLVFPDHHWDLCLGLVDPGSRQEGL
jgi:hypothetical protein